MVVIFRTPVCIKKDGCHFVYHFFAAMDIDNMDVVQLIRDVHNSTGMIGLYLPRNIPVECGLVIPPLVDGFICDTIQPHWLRCVDQALPLWALEEQENKSLALVEDARFVAADGLQWLLLQMVVGPKMRGSFFISKFIEVALCAIVGEDKAEELKKYIASFRKLWWGRKDAAPVGGEIRSILYDAGITSEKAVFLMNIVIRPALLFRVGEYNGKQLARGGPEVERVKISLPKTESSSVVDGYAMDEVIKASLLEPSEPVTGKKRKRAPAAQKPRKKQKKKQQEEEELEEGELPEGSKSPEGFQSPSEIEKALDAVFQNGVI